MHFGAAVYRDESDRAAAERGVRRFEFAYFDDLLIRHELHETAVERVGVWGRLAHSLRRVIRERDPKHATLAALDTCT